MIIISLKPNGIRWIPVLFSLALIACTNQQTEPAGGSVVPAKDNLQNSVSSSAISHLATDSAITFIRNAFQQINTMPLKSETFTWTVDGCNADGTATYYFTSGHEIMKVVETGTIGDSYWETAYYYKSGHFLFSLETNIGGPAVGPVDTFTVRKYAYADTVIRTTRDDTYTTPVDNVLTPAAKEYRILKAYQSKEFGAAFCE